MIKTGNSWPFIEDFQPFLYSTRLKKTKQFTMKKKQLLSVLALLASIFSYGQFYDTNAQFHLSFSNYSFTPNGYQESTIISDTIIDGVTTNRLVFGGQHIETTGPGQQDTTDFETLDTLLTYTNNDSVFIYRENDFHLAFMMSGEVDDIWDLGPHEDYANDPEIKDNHTYLKVVATGDTMIGNGVTLNFLDVLPCTKEGVLIGYPGTPGNPDSVLVPFHSGRIIEKIGLTQNMMNMAYAFPVGTIVDGGDDYLICFNSLNLGFIDFHPTKNCYFDLKANVEELNVNTEFEVYPNPSSGRVTLSFHSSLDKVDLLVLNTLGQKVLEMREVQSEQEVGLNSLPEGVYFLILQQKERAIGFKRIQIQ